MKRLVKEEKGPQLYESATRSPINHYTRCTNETEIKPAGTLTIDPINSRATIQNFRKRERVRSHGTRLRLLAFRPQKLFGQLRRGGGSVESVSILWGAAATRGAPGKEGQSFWEVHDYSHSAWHHGKCIQLPWEVRETSYGLYLEIMNSWMLFGVSHLHHQACRPGELSNSATLGRFELMAFLLCDESEVGSS
jgi:hypothetical protein